MTLHDIDNRLTKQLGVIVRAVVRGHVTPSEAWYNRRLMEEAARRHRLALLENPHV